MSNAASANQRQFLVLSIRNQGYCIKLENTSLGENYTYSSASINGRARSLGWEVVSGSKGIAVGAPSGDNS